MKAVWFDLEARLRLYRLAAVAVAGRGFWLLPALPLGWLLVLGVASALGLRGGYEPVMAQGLLMGVPLALLAGFLGVRVIAGEIDGRSLEIAYTVPGGCERVWWTKLAGGMLMLLIAQALLAVAVWLFFTHYPLGALYGALQAAVFYLVLSMALATLFRNEVAGGMATVAVMGLNGLVTGFGANQVRVSPFFNPHAAETADPAELLGWTVQNRIGIALFTCGIAALAFMRANRRERMLDG